MSRVIQLTREYYQLNAIGVMAACLVGTLNLSDHHGLPSVSVLLTGL